MAEINSFMFRDYDIRGLAGSDLTATSAELVGKAFGTYLKRRGQSELIVGRDARVSSPELTNALIKGLISTGCKVKDIGLASWGFINYALRQQTGNAIFVSASHNPPEYNGFKMVVKKQSIFGQDVHKLVELINNEDFEAGKGNCTELNLLENYVSFIKSKAKLKRKIKFVVDCANGMGALVGPRIFKELDCEVIELYCDIDGTFPNHPADPVVPENLQDLIIEVKKNRAELGIAFDGDGDRIGIVDEKGNIIFGDRLGAVFSKQILNKRPNSKILFEVNCSQALREVIEKYGGVPIEVRVGHSIIEKEMEKQNGMLAVEVSGHTFFADDFYGVDDAIYVALRLLEIVSETNRPVSSLFADCPIYYSSPQFRPHCEDGKKAAVVCELTKEFQNQGFKVSTIDGVKVFFEDGWGLVRVSNTAPQLTLRFEGKSKEAMEKIQKLFFDKLKEHGVEVK